MILSGYLMAFLFDTQKNIKQYFCVFLIGIHVGFERI